MGTDNEIIAEFMLYPVNYEYRRSSPSKKVVKRILKYDKSWDWLMPVVEKIQDTQVIKGRVIRTAADVQIMYKACHIEYSGDEESGDYSGEWEIRSSSTTKIKAVYRAVVKFIKWYNTQKS